MKSVIQELLQHIHCSVNTVGDQRTLNLGNARNLKQTKKIENKYDLNSNKFLCDYFHDQGKKLISKLVNLEKNKFNTVHSFFNFSHRM